MRAAYKALKPAECWDWLTLNDMLRIAKQAMRRARDECYPPKGERFLDGTEPWSSPADFAETLTRLLVLHVQVEAHAAGIPGYECTPEQLAAWYSGAGRSPANKGQGWPALALPVGPGHRDASAFGEASPTPADALPYSSERTQ